MTDLDSFILQHRTDAIDRLALQLSARRDIDAAYVLQQVEGWQRLRVKVPTWAAVDGLHYPPRLALEQCSGEPAARHKAALVARLMAGSPRPWSMADLTGGLGVDFSFVAPIFDRATYVERQEVLATLARHNFPLLGLPEAQVVHADGVEHLRQMEPVSLLFLDPARRDGAGRKTVLIEDCQPDVCALQQLLLAKAEWVVLKLSTMLDIVQALRSMRHVKEVHVVAAGGECKDLLMVLQRGWEGEPLLHAVEGEADLAFTLTEESAAPCPMAQGVGRYLYEPGPALLKAGAFRLTAARFGLQKLHPNSHLYTGDALVPAFPGRCFEVRSVCGFGKRDLKQLKARLEQANLTVRNFPASVDALRKKLKLREGGNAYLFATTMGENEHLLVECVKAQRVR